MTWRSVSSCARCALRVWNRCVQRVFCRMLILEAAGAVVRVARTQTLRRACSIARPAALRVRVSTQPAIIRCASRCAATTIPLATRTPRNAFKSARPALVESLAFAQPACWKVPMVGPVPLAAPAVPISGFETPCRIALRCVAARAARAAECTYPPRAVDRSRQLQTHG